MCSCDGATWKRRWRNAPGCPDTARRRSCAISTHPRRSRRGSTRCGPSRFSTGSRRRHRMPFRWTINVYRGCAHACTYCVRADTPILMADGRHKPISELEVGDAIYGTRVAASGHRHYVRTTVLDKWITIKPAYRLTLEGGTELILSGDHRLLSNRGWKHLLGSPRGQPDRPFLIDAQQTCGDRAACLPAAARRRLPSRISVRNHPRGRLAALVRLPACPGRAVQRLSLPTCARRRRGAEARTRVSGLDGCRHQRTRLPARRRGASRDDCDIRAGSVLV